MKTNAEIQNIENEILMLLFHKETLEAKVEHIRKKISGDNKIVVVGSLSEASGENLLTSINRVFDEKDIPDREEFFNTYAELLQIVNRINSMQNQMESYKTHAARLKNQDALGIEDEKIEKLVLKAKMLYGAQETKLKLELVELINRHRKGLNTMKDKISFVQALKFALLKAAKTT
jgi:hypothetical protein